MGIYLVGGILLFFTIITGVKKAIRGLKKEGTFR